MQAPTHILTGIFLLAAFKAIFPLAPLWVQVVVVLLLAVASHFILDASSIITYHPPKSDWKDWFWVTYHLVIYISAVVILVFFLIADYWYWWVIIAANLPDLIDWLLLRAILKKEPVMHKGADKLRNFLFKKTPNWNHKRWTIIIEFVIIALLLTGVLLLQMIIES